MLKKRIIPCLDVKNGRTVKGTNFLQLRDAGDPIELGKKYSDEGADELVFLDISATNEKRKTAIELAEKVAQSISIPFIIGGGVSSVEDIRAVLKAGADKVAINSAAVRNPQLISECANIFGSQAIVVAIDAKYQSSEYWEVFVSGGKTPTGLNAREWAKEVEILGAGEILLTSMDRDGTKQGYDIALTKSIAHAVSIPLIASGGVGKKKDFLEVFQHTPATGALAASVFHFAEINIAQLKQYLHHSHIPVRI